MCHINTMSKIHCSTSLELSNFADTHIRPDFTFIVDRCKYKCKTIQLCSISNLIFKQISNVHFIDIVEFQYNNLESDGIANDYDQYFSFNFDEIKNENKNNNITCDKLKDPHHYFQLFLNAVEGKNITITKFNAFFLNYVASILQIDELKKATEPFMSFKLNTTNAIQILFYFSESNIRNNEVINYVSSNWSKFDFPVETLLNYASSSKSSKNKPEFSKLVKMLQFPYEFFNFIFSSKSFRPRSEDWLLNFIIILVKQHKDSRDYCLLFKYIKFEQISNVNISKAIRYIAFDVIPPGFVESFEKRFTSDIDGQPLIYEEEEEILEENDYYDDELEDDEKEDDEDDDDNDNDKKIKFSFKHEYNTLFRGVFSFFKKNKIFDQNVRCFCGGAKQGLLFHLFEYNDSIIFEYYWDSFKTGNDISNAWFVITFPNHKFKLKNYTLATSPISREYVQKGVQPKSWIIEGSNTVINAYSSHLSGNDDEKANAQIDEAKWDLITKEEDSKVLLNNENTIKTFGVEKRYREYYRSFRYRMLKNNVTPDVKWYGLLKLNAIEFYGTLVKCSKKKK